MIILISICYGALCAAVVHNDVKHRIIPDWLTVPGIFLGIWLNTCLNNFDGFKFANEGALLGAFCLLISGCIGIIIYDRPGVGGGDVKLLAMIGAFWGWQVSLITFAIAPFMGSIYAGVKNKSSLPYGVFLIFASFIAILIKGVIL